LRFVNVNNDVADWTAVTLTSSIGQSKMSDLLKLSPEDDSRLFNKHLAGHISQEEVEQIHVAWTKTSNLTQRWRLCQPLVRAKMWAIEPLPGTVSALIKQYAEDGNFIHALPLQCFLSMYCDPHNYPAPFDPWRVKGFLSTARLISLLPPQVLPNDSISVILAQSDVMSICEAMLRLVLRLGAFTFGSGHDILLEATAMLVDIEKLEDRKESSLLLEGWTNDPGNTNGRAFFNATVAAPMGRLARCAIEIMDGRLT
jgi:hypothetical protein